MNLKNFLRDNSQWLLAGGLLTFLSSFGQTFFISIFAGEIQSEFDLSHGAWGSIYAIGTLGSAITMIWIGALTDHFRVRSLGIWVLAGLACACLMMTWVKSPMVLILVIFALRLTGQGMTSHIAVVAMARWFVATRGRALSIAALGYAVGESLLPVGFVFLMSFMDWRLLWVLAALIVVSGVPIMLRLLSQERTPQSMAEESASLGMQKQHWTRNMALRHPLFWFMVPSLIGPSAFVTALFFHQVHIADLKDISHVSFVALFPVYTGVAIGAMLFSGWALDKWGTARLIPFYQLPMVAAFLIFGASDGILTLTLGFAVLALTSGANGTLPNAFWAEFYGTKFIGSIKAMAAAVMVLGSAIGPGLTGALIDQGIGIETQFVFVALFFCIASLSAFIGIRAYAPAFLSGSV